MQLDHSFQVPVPQEETWRLFHDIEAIAPCMPGAVLDRADENSFEGRVKVKVGAVAMSYRGKGTITRDEAARRVVLDLSGSETRGGGTATATVTATLTPDGEGTAVRVRTDLDLTGKPAQFGRGILVEVGDRLVQQFAGNLQKHLSAQPDAGTAVPDAVLSAAPAASTAAEPEALDVGAAVWPALAKRAKVPALVAGSVAVTLLAVRLLRRKSA